MTTELTSRRRVEPYSAIIMGILAAGFAAWALLTLPLQGAAILTLASVLGWTGWITFSYKRPVKPAR